MVIASALVTAATFLVLAWFIHRLGIVEGQGIVRPLGTPARTIPAQRMIGVRNPFQLYSANFEPRSYSQVYTLSSISKGGI